MLTSIFPYVNSKVPDSILERSNISEMSCNSKSLFFCIIERYSCCSWVSWVSTNKLENPTIALRGVRISWLILAKKADFSLSKVSALFLASINSVSIAFVSVISKFTPINSILFLAGSYSLTVILQRSHFRLPGEVITRICFFRLVIFPAIISLYPCISIWASSGWRWA